MLPHAHRSPAAAVAQPGACCCRVHALPLACAVQALQQQLEAAGDDLQALKAVVTAAGTSDAGAVQGLSAAACCPAPSWLAPPLCLLLRAGCPLRQRQPVGGAPGTPDASLRCAPLSGAMQAESLKVKEAALGRLTDLLVKAGDAAALRSLLTDLRPLFAAM